MESIRQLYHSYALELWLGLLVIVVAQLIGLILLHVRLSFWRERLNSLGEGQSLAGLPSEGAPTSGPEGRLSRALHWIGIVRFNPFSDTGGDQSFSVALVDGEGNGVVITSLHGRRETRVYAKPLEGWGSTYSLTEEEQEAIAQALRQRDEAIGAQESQP